MKQYDKSEFITPGRYSATKKAPSDDGAFFVKY
jgi:hypothetical protein